MDSLDCNSPRQDALLADWQLVLHRRADEAAILNDDGRALRTIAQIEEDAVAFATQFAKLNLIQGNILLFLAANDPAWPGVLLAALRTGVTLMPAEPDFRCADDIDWLETMGVAAIAKLDDSQFSLQRTNILPCQWEGDVPAMLKLTSGTTGKPRAVRFTSMQLWHDGDRILHDMALLPGDRNLAAIAFAHSYGLGNLVLPLLMQGIALVLVPNPLPHTLAHACTSGAATVFAGVPLMFRALAQSPGIKNLGSLRLCISAGAPLDSEVAKEFEARYKLAIHPFYGSSECGGISYDSASDCGTVTGRVGSVMRHNTLTLQPVEGDLANCQIAGPGVGDAYHPSQPGDEEVLHGGVFCPADLVEFIDGALHLRGRRDDLINRAGRKIHPAEVETALLRAGCAKEAVVFGVKNGSREPLIVAAVVGAILEDQLIRRHCAASLPAWMLPERIWRVESIPANSRGKTSRKLLAALWLDTFTNKSTINISTCKNKVFM